MPKRRKAKRWSVEWRGKITRNVGWEDYYGDTAAHAKAQFQRDYPMREVVAVVPLREETVVPTGDLPPDREEAAAVVMSRVLGGFVEKPRL